MPNHVKNVLVVRGTEDSVTKARALLLKHIPDTPRLNWQDEPILDDEGNPAIDAACDVVDFELALPMPELLKGMSSGFSTIDGEEVQNWITTKEECGNCNGTGTVVEDDPECGIHEFECSQCLGGMVYTNRKLTEEEQQAVYLHGDWYSWSCNNWGTKWNAYETNICADTIKRIELNFETAWSFPYGWYDAFCKQLIGEDLLIELSWADEDFGNNTGIVSFDTKENMLLLTEFGDGSEEAYQHAVSVKGYDPQEEYPEDYEDEEWTFNDRPTKTEMGKLVDGRVLLSEKVTEEERMAAVLNALKGSIVE